MDIVPEKNTEAAAPKQRPSMSGNWQWLISESLLPVIAIVYLYRQNMEYVSADWLLLVCGLLFLFSALAWWIAYLIFRSPLSAFLSVAVCWVVCFTQVSLTAFLIDTIGLRDNGLILLTGFAIFVATVLGFFARKLKISNFAGIFVLSMTSLMLLINIIPIIIGIGSYNDAAVLDAIKTDFTVETREEQPNVYWFHCDGMLGFSAMEKYFGDPQTDFANELNARGFEINRDAEFESGHLTQKALPSLMSPYAYDTWISPLFATHEAAMRTDLFSPLFQLRSCPELTNAFKEGGYHTSHQCENIYILPIAETNYASFMTDSTSKVEIIKNDSDEYLFEWMNHQNTVDFFYSCSGYFSVLIDVLMPNNSLTTLDLSTEPLSTYLDDNTLQSIGLSENGADIIEPIANTLNDILIKDNAPHFSILSTFSAHYPFVVDENGNNVHEPDNMRVSDYPAQHRFTATVLLNMVDMILEADPDAVIVLQADHGLHGNTEKDFREAFGTEDAALDMWNSVMSAMRVPEKYKNGDEHYALETPLNISRYLVNSFVGHNYAYISK